MKIKFKSSLLNISIFTSSFITGIASALAAFFARQVIMPAKIREETVPIKSFLGNNKDIYIIFPVNQETTAKGLYSVYFNKGRGHARIGKIISYKKEDKYVVREVEKIYTGNLQNATKVWISGTCYHNPSSLNLQYSTVNISSNAGIMPAWSIKSKNKDTKIWAIMIHGWASNRQECLRAVPTIRNFDINSLLISYRNDIDAPSTSDGRYNLGMTEWIDVEASIKFALSQGAKQIILIGWSMGGAIALQTVDKSKFKKYISGIILNSPVIDWVNVLSYQAKINNIPQIIRKLSQIFLSKTWGKYFTGLRNPVNLKDLDWVRRSDELSVPTLILHSKMDNFVPIKPSENLACKNSKLVTLKKFSTFSHAKEWNGETSKWENSVTSWLYQILK